MRRVNLLVTNTRNAQAYAIIRALRPHANKIIATMEGDNRVSAWFSHAARSRLVDRCYFTPSPAADWRAGRIQRDNTETEERYLRAVTQICETENIDTIVPSFDPHVYVFSKNKERFERLGVLIPVPEYETILMSLDKYRTICAAQEVGFPCPATRLAESEEELQEISKELGFPLVIKPRVTAAGRGTAIVMGLQELLTHYREATLPGSYMIQEYIPGSQLRHVIFAISSAGLIRMCIGRRAIRSLYRLHQHFGTAQESVDSHHTTQAARLVQKIGWRGVIAVQMKIDSRDGTPKLMEINPRMGHGVWNRIAVGINEPLMALKVARGEELEAAGDCPAGTLFLNPVEDVLGLGVKIIDLIVHKFRVNVQGRTAIDASNAPPSFRELARSYKDTYLGRRRRLYDFYFTHFCTDPVVSIVWWLQILSVLRNVTRELGR